MKLGIRIVIVGAGCLLTLRGAESARDQSTVTLPPVVVDGSRPKAPASSGPRWKLDLLRPGFVLKIDHPTRIESLLFAEGDLVRGVFGSKAEPQANRAILSFQRLRWHLEDEWLVFVDEKSQRVEELRLIKEGWFSLTAEKRNGEVVKFKVTKPSALKLPPVVKP